MRIHALRRMSAMTLTNSLALVQVREHIVAPETAIRRSQQPYIIRTLKILSSALLLQMEEVLGGSQ